MDKSSVFFLTRISNHHPEKFESTYLQATWDKGTIAPCIGYCRNDGIFEYKDINTNISQYYQIFETNHEKVIGVNSQWGEFRFLCANYAGYLCFTLQKSTQVYQTQFATNEEMKIGFPNVEQSENGECESFPIILLFDTQVEITTFDLDHESELIYCGLINGDIVIGSRTKECILYTIKSAHEPCVNTLVPLVSAVVTAGRDQSILIWDFSWHNDNENGMVKYQSKLLHKFEIQSSSVTVMHCFSLMGKEEILCVATVEGTIFIYSFDKLTLINILHVDCSEILTLSTMKDGTILCVGQLNGNVTLFATDTWSCIGLQSFSKYPIICANYHPLSSIDHFIIIDSQCNEKFYAGTMKNNNNENNSYNNSKTTSGIETPIDMASNSNITPFPTTGDWPRKMPPSYSNESEITMTQNGVNSSNYNNIINDGHTVTVVEPTWQTPYNPNMYQEYHNEMDKSTSSKKKHKKEKKEKKDKKKKKKHKNSDKHENEKNEKNENCNIAAANQENVNTLNIDKSNHNSNVNNDSGNNNIVNNKLIHVGRHSFERSKERNKNINFEKTKAILKQAQESIDNQLINNENDLCHHSMANSMPTKMTTKYFENKILSTMNQQFDKTDKEIKDQIRLKTKEMQMSNENCNQNGINNHGLNLNEKQKRYDYSELPSLKQENIENTFKSTMKQYTLNKQKFKSKYENGNETNENEKKENNGNNVDDTNDNQYQLLNATKPNNIFGQRQSIAVIVKQQQKLIHSRTLEPQYCHMFDTTNFNQAINVEMLDDKKRKKKKVKKYHSFYRHSCLNWDNTNFNCSVLKDNQ